MCFTISIVSGSIWAFPKRHVYLNAYMLPAVVAILDVLYGSNFYLRHSRSQANLTSWSKRTSVRKGHKVKQIMCSQYPLSSVASRLFCLLGVFLMGPLIPSPGLCRAVGAGHSSGRGWDQRGQGHVRPPVTPLSALMHSGQSYMLFQVCRRLRRQQIVIKSNLVLKDDLDTWLHQRKTGEVSVCNGIVDESSMIFLPRLTL